LTSLSPQRLRVFISPWCLAPRGEAIVLAKSRTASSQLTRLPSFYLFRALQVPEKCVLPAREELKAFRYEP